MAATVLIADGEEGLLSLMKASLTKEGFHVLTSNSGHEALNLARQENPDLILLELGLPDMDGFEFIHHRSYDVHHSDGVHHSDDDPTPIIMLAAVSGIDDRVRCLELGADDFITKPFTLRELSLRVQAVLRRAGRSAPQVEALQSVESLRKPDYRLTLA